jgi:DNA-binding MarR family transcriptional regulator
MNEELAGPVPGFYVPGQYRADQSVGFLMKRVMSSILAQADQRLASLDLTHAQWLPLFKLAVKDCDTVAALARELDLDPGAMTRALDRLEAKGLVLRERSTEDRRVVRLRLTEEGRKIARKVPPVMAEVLNQHLAGFSEAEWKQLLALLARMVANGDALRDPTAA